MDHIFMSKVLGAWLWKQFAKLSVSIKLFVKHGDSFEIRA